MNVPAAALLRAVVGVNYVIPAMVVVEVSVAAPSVKVVATPPSLNASIPRRVRRVAHPAAHHQVARHQVTSAPVILIRRVRPIRRSAARLRARRARVPPARRAAHPAPRRAVLRVRVRRARALVAVVLPRVHPQAMISWISTRNL